MIRLLRALRTAFIRFPTLFGDDWSPNVKECLALYWFKKEYPQRYLLTYFQLCDEKFENILYISFQPTSDKLVTPTPYTAYRIQMAENIAIELDLSKDENSVYLLNKRAYLPSHEL
ncbi:MAG: hypothetical protein R3B84_01860 [Zavarzinella sp.]